MLSTNIEGHTISGLDTGQG